jgi:hypothetical protein
MPMPNIQEVCTRNDKYVACVLDFTHTVWLSDAMLVRWRVDNGIIAIEATARTNGWMGFGFSANGAMGGADIVVAWFNNAVC